MIKRETITEAMYNAIRLGATKMPPDIRKALQRALEEETDPMAKKHLEISLQNADMSEKGNGLVCADTTAECFLRPTMVHPLTRKNPGDNVGPGMPKVELFFDREGDGMEILAAPKGGGSEIFGTFYRMLFPADGEAGIKKFVIECIKDACYAGKVCPPAIIGVGIGGTADLCMSMAKKAALLRPIGEHHPDPEVARLEKELYAAARQLGIGPMGSRGINAVLAINLDAAVTHTAALPVAVNAQCLVGRRWIAKVDGNGNVDYTGDIFKTPQKSSKA